MCQLLPPAKWRPLVEGETSRLPGTIYSWGFRLLIRDILLLPPNLGKRPVQGILPSPAAFPHPRAGSFRLFFPQVPQLLMCAVLMVS